MVLAVVRQWRREGRKPPRDVVLGFLADEEAGGKFGAHWMVDNHPGQFEGVSEAISEVGGFSFSIGNERIYLIETAQKGIRWLRLVAEGRAGHGSTVNDENAVTALAEAVARIGRHEWPLRMTPTVQRFFEEVTDALGIELDLADPGPALAKLGGLANSVGATLRNTANPTMLKAGYKHNVIPQSAEAMVDCRFLPGFEDELLATIDELIGPDVAARRSSPTSRWRPPSTAPSSTRWWRRCRRRTRARGRCLTASRPAPTTSPSACWASAASASRRRGCRRTWTSPRCSTVWTSGCRWTRCSSAPGCWTASSPPADLLHDREHQTIRK